MGVGCRRAMLSATLVVVAGCGWALSGYSGGDDQPLPDRDGGRGDGVPPPPPSDSGVPEGSTCDLAAPWGDIAPLAELNSGADDWSARLTADELTVVLASARP